MVVRICGLHQANCFLWDFIVLSSYTRMDPTESLSASGPLAKTNWNGGYRKAARGQTSKGCYLSNPTLALSEGTYLLLDPFLGAGGRALEHSAPELRCSGGKEVN